MKLKTFSKFFIICVVLPLSVTLILDIFYGRFFIEKNTEKKYRVHIQFTIILLNPTILLTKLYGLIGGTLCAQIRVGLNMIVKAQN